MLQGHVEKYPMYGCQAPVRFLHCSFDTELQGSFILLERFGSAAIDIPPELVEQQDQGQPTPGLVGPVVELTG